MANETSQMIFEIRSIQTAFYMGGGGSRLLPKVISDVIVHKRISLLTLLSQCFIYKNMVDLVFFYTLDVLVFDQ